jgi:hypothetical protein
LVQSRTPPTINVGEDTGKKQPSYTAGGNVSFGTTILENNMVAS